MSKQIEEFTKIDTLSYLENKIGNQEFTIELLILAIIKDKKSTLNYPYVYGFENIKSHLQTLSQEGILTTRYISDNPTYPTDWCMPKPHRRGKITNTVYQLKIN